MLPFCNALKESESAACASQEEKQNKQGGGGEDGEKVQLHQERKMDPSLHPMWGAKPLWTVMLCSWCKVTAEPEAFGVVRAVQGVCVEQGEGPWQRTTRHLVRGASCVPGRQRLFWSLFLTTQPQKNLSVEPSPSWSLLRENSRALNPDLAGSQSQREHKGRPSLSVLKCLKKVMFPIIRCEREREAWPQLMEASSYLACLKFCR